MYVGVRDVGPEGLEVDCTVVVEGLEDRAHQGVEVTPVRVQGSVRRSGAGVSFRGTLQATETFLCSRCLDRFPEVVDLRFRLLYRERGPAASGDDDDPAIAYLDDDRIDLKQLVEEQLYLAMPLKPLCRPDCHGLCPACGARQGETPCGCRPEETDPRLAPLLELKRLLER